MQTAVAQKYKIHINRIWDGIFTPLLEVTIGLFLIPWRLENIWL